MAFMTEQSEQKPEARQGQTTKLVLLLILLGIFGYLYFFTSLIRPQEERAKQEAPPPAVSQMVKKPIPPKDGAAKGEKPSAEGTKSAKEVPKPVQTASLPREEKKLAPPPAPPKSAPAPSPQKGEPAAKGAPVTPAKEKPAPAAPKVGASSPAPKKEPQKAPATTGETPKPRPVSAEKKGPAVPRNEGGRFAISFGDLPEGAVLNDLKKRLAAAKITPVTTRPVTRKVTMHRLLVSEQGDHDTALREVASLRKRKVDAFMGEAGDRYRVYAGSYLYRDRADEEVKRLASQGITVTVVEGEAEVKLQSVTAGSFADRQQAEKARSAVTGKGPTPTVVERK
ncbi:MAG: SPOR domain-containing protein [Desulfuromonadia bacterium]